MDNTKWPALSGLVAGTVLISRDVPTTFALDQPVHSSLIFLASAAFAVLVSSRLLPRSSHDRRRPLKDDTIPLQSYTGRVPSPSREDAAHPPSPRRPRTTLSLLIVALCLRAIVLWDMVGSPRCRLMSWEPLIPLVFAIWDYWTVQRKKRWSADDDAGDSIYDALGRFVLRSSYVLLLATTFLSAGSMLAVKHTAYPASTYICGASHPPFRGFEPALQYFGTALDVVILSCAASILALPDGRGVPNAALRSASIGWAMLASSLVLSLYTLARIFLQIGERADVSITPSLYVWSVVRLDFYISLSLVCAILAIFHVGIMTTTMLTTFTSVATITTPSAWASANAYPPQTFHLALWGFSIAIVGILVYTYVDAARGRDDCLKPHSSLFKKVPHLLPLGLLCLFLRWSVASAAHKNVVSYHPVTMLIYEAQERHLEYVNQSSAGQTVAQAVANYQRRYHRSPPPNFDFWHQYAKSRDTLIIDEYDNIYSDLLPFWGLSASEIRERTTDLIKDPNYDVVGISIRNGKVGMLPESARGQHEWLSAGLVDMIAKFSHRLPNMDLAFNVDDGPQVVVPHEQVVHMREAGMASSNMTAHIGAFSRNRKGQWPALRDGAQDTSQRVPWIDMSYKRTFHEFANAGCPSASAARTQKHRDTGTLCTYCTSPQSLGAFLSNWTTAANICHQSDLADLHGFYSSPASFKAAHTLLPIFSQSKAYGFNDIVFPSIWDYQEKATFAPNQDQPEPTFEQKNGTLFWRGATSEGISSGQGQWRGMLRQRFVHLANGIDGSVASPALLLPEPVASKRGKLEYVNVAPSRLQQLLPMDVQFVESILRCGGIDCVDQEAQFAPLAPAIDFQSHWKYRYLLDLDGASSSGRFLPFLRSGSLPFKASIFREWWDSRITPWAHFVPIDVRGHGLWATLAYFQGIEGVVDGKDVIDVGHRRDAQRIATQGQEWAGKVLRKEDMEVYMFRLLLEWGRLTDDDRESLGYTGG